MKTNPATAYLLEQDRDPRTSAGGSECDAHGILEALMVDHSDEIRFVLDLLWRGLSNPPADVVNAVYKSVIKEERARYQAIHDRISRLHREFRLQRLAEAQSKKPAAKRRKGRAA